MCHCNDFILNFMKRYAYPEQAVSEFTRVLKRLDCENDFGGGFDEIFSGFISGGCRGLSEELEAVTLLARKYGENAYTLHFVFILSCMPELFGRYKTSGIPENVYWASMDDLRCKLIECINCKGVPGTFVGDWNGGFLEMERFAFGRFQYEERQYPFDFDFTTRCGLKLTKGARVLNFHIPSSGIPLTDEVRFDSYRKAYKHYSGLFPDGLTVFFCESWLLYPAHRDFLPESSNILKFLNDFEIVEWGEHDRFYDGWRVFAKYSSEPPERLPTDTSLRRAFADRLKKGLPTGYGVGVFVFDGKNILR